MPSSEWNETTWDRQYDWSLAGDEWSDEWGSPSAQWQWSILPRIIRYLPANTILEIAPGYGRWSQYLQAECSKLLLVDISQTCIDHCIERFKEKDHIEYFKNDGASLDMVPDGSVDLVFSFDSLVHVELDILECYLSEIASKLTADGVAFIHHSNLGQFRYFTLLRKLEAVFKPKGSIASDVASVSSEAEKTGIMSRFVNLIARVLMKLRLTDRSHMRAISVSANEVASLCERYGLKCVSQECINWGKSYRPIDCISVVTRADSTWANDWGKIVNKQFMSEAEYVRKLSKMYQS